MPHVHPVKFACGDYFTGAPCFSPNGPQTDPILTVGLSGGHQVFESVINGRGSSAAVFRNNRDLECMMHTNSNTVTMMEFGTDNLYPTNQSHVFATSIPNQQLITHLNNETMLP